jgi:hypothetical protein
MAKALVRWAVAAAFGLLAGPGVAIPVSSAVPQQAMVDVRARIPQATVLRGHADDFDDVADLLEELGCDPESEEPELREVIRSDRGYEYAIVIPDVAAAREAEPPLKPSLFGCAESWLNRGLWWLLEPPDPPPPPRVAVPRQWSGVPSVALESEEQGRRPFADLAIDEITVEAIYLTSVGGVARVQARGRRFWLRDGDRLADGEVDGIDFLGPTFAWLRLRRRVHSTPGVPYRPVVWMLAAHPQASRPGGEPGRGLGVGGDGSAHVEALRLGDGRLAGGGYPPWTWVLSVAEAPRFVAATLATVDDPVDLLATNRFDLGFQGTAVSFSARGSVRQALAAAGVPIPAARPKPPAAPPNPAPGPGDLDLIFNDPIDELPFGYDPTSRRDPFIDLSARNVLRPIDRVVRPWGVPGLLIDEITVEGLFRTPRGAVAEVRSPGRHRDFLREGDQLYDGDVMRIDLQRGVEFQQIVQDWMALKPFRRVVRRADLRWIAAPGPWPQTASGPAAASTSPSPPATPSGASWIDAIVAREEAMMEEPFPDQPADRRDPFRSLGPDDAPGEAPPAVLATLTCNDVAQVGADRLADVLTLADRLLARYEWERGLVGNRPGGSDSWARRFLADVAESASADVARLVSGLSGAEKLWAGSPPRPAETFALLGDLNVVAGRLTAAASSYAAAERLAPGQATLCGRLYDGKLYVAESFATLSFLTPYRNYRQIQLTGYLLAWDLASGRVLERHLLPAKPARLTVEDGKLRIRWKGREGAGSVRLARRRLEAPAPLPADFLLRLSAIRSSRLLADNFVGSRPEELSLPFAVRRDIDPRLPLALPELEQALRQATLRDPTQPWHRFFLGQALWARGRRREAEIEWRRIWQGGPRATPYYEFLRMAALYEGYGQLGWSDRAFGHALERRRRLSPPIAFCGDLLRFANADIRRLDVVVHDPDRRYRWWRRLREITGLAPGDAFSAALWVADREQRGEWRQARAELADLERARRNPFDLHLRCAWIDYSCYGVVAFAAMLFAQLAVLGGRLVRLAQDRRAWPSWRGALRASRRSLPPLLCTALALYLATSFTILALSHQSYLASLPIELGDVAVPGGAAGASADRLELTRGDLWFAWLAAGVVLPAKRAPAPGRQALLLLAAIAVMLVVALPVGLLLTWGRVRDFVIRWLPGAADVRAGAHFRGFAAFGLFVFALLPLAWLGVARTQGAVPAPGLLTAVYFPNLRACSIVPRSVPERDLELQCARSFLRLLLVYPGARAFWSLVLAALAASLSLHVYGAGRRRLTDRRIASE